MKYKGVEGGGEGRKLWMVLFCRQIMCKYPGQISDAGVGNQTLKDSLTYIDLSFVGIFIEGDMALCIKQGMIQKSADVDFPLDFSVNVLPVFSGWKTFSEDTLLPCQAA